MTRKTKNPGMKKAKLPKLPATLRKSFFLMGKKLIKNFALSHSDKPPTRELVLDSADALLDEHKSVRMTAAESLELVAQKGTDISPAFPSLIKALSDDEAEVRSHAVAAFNFSSNRDIGNLDITAAIPELVKRLSDPNGEIAQNAGNVLRNRKYAHITIHLIMELIHSDWFIQEMEKNSPTYESTTNNVARVLSMIKGQEKRGENDP